MRGDDDGSKRPHAPSVDGLVLLRPLANSHAGSVGLDPSVAASDRGRHPAEVELKLILGVASPVVQFRGVERKKPVPVCPLGIGERHLKNAPNARSAGSPNTKPTTTRRI